eukprot:TRINITY_DN13046_c0_g1_i1.p1 TRINITY_DN13046_c0_g1~~TRINITY_DN13046_c0_g1_i1.p1  ORF type:complete len:333 (+),score=65.86 TRINITY_DN13046_c0_g1_i1:56-1000(+)
MPTLTQKTCRYDEKDIVVDVGVVEGDDVFEVASEEEIIMVVPGNPGLASFYLKFARYLIKELEKNEVSRRVVCLGFAGHASGRAHNNTVFGASQQIGFVKALADKILEKNPKAKLHLVGHSVGAYVSVHVAAKIPQENVRTVTGLFPTVEHIAKGDNAVTRPLFLPGLRHFAASLASVVGYLPIALRKKIGGFFATTTEPEHLEVVASMTDYNLVNNILYMASTEMHEIQDICHTTLSTIAAKCSFYYGVSDGWVPQSLIPDMRKHLESHTGSPPSSCVKEPLPRVIIDGTTAPHAFVLTHSEEVAKEISPIFL